MNFEDKSIISIEKKQQNSTQPKQYSSPRLEELGDLRSLTLGVSNGTGESGNAGTHYNFGSSPFGMPPYGG